MLSDDWKDINMPMYFQETDTPLTVQENEDIQEMAVDSAEEPMEVDSSESPKETEIASGDISDNEQENDANASAYPEQTMLLDDSDFLTHAIKHAPGEGQRPISLLWDLNAEVLTFPTIYCGQKRNVNPKLSYTDIAKSEALNRDRRACKHPKLLYSFKKSHLQQVVDSITISLKKAQNRETLLLEASLILTTRPGWSGAMRTTTF